MIAFFHIKTAYLAIFIGGNFQSFFRSAVPRLITGYMKVVGKILPDILNFFFYPLLFFIAQTNVITLFR